CRFRDIRVDLGGHRRNPVLLRILSPKRSAMRGKIDREEMNGRPVECAGIDEEATPGRNTVSQTVDEPDARAIPGGRSTASIEMKSPMLLPDQRARARLPETETLLRFMPFDGKLREKDEQSDSER